MSFSLVATEKMLASWPMSWVEPEPPSESSNSTSTRSGRFLQSHSMPQTEPASSSGTPQKTRSRGERGLGALEQQHGHQMHDAAALHVDRTAPVDLALLDVALEGGLGPVGLLDGDDVEVVAEHHRPLGAVAAQPGEDSLALGLDFDVFDLHAGLGEDLAHPAGGGFLVAGRVGRVNLEVVDEVVEGFVEDGLPVDCAVGGHPIFSVVSQSRCGSG